MVALSQFFSVFGQGVTEDSKAIGKMFFSLSLLLSNQSDLSALRSWGSYDLLQQL